VERKKNEFFFFEKKIERNGIKKKDRNFFLLIKISKVFYLFLMRKIFFFGLIMEKMRFEEGRKKRFKFARKERFFEGLLLL
jgi:hypothetical protein